MDSFAFSLSTALPALSPHDQHFRFFSLPYELRSRILIYVLAIPHTIDLNPDNYRAAHQRLNLFLTSHKLHHEASHLFYSMHTFRIFPTHGRFFAPKTVPLIARLPTRYRKTLSSLELRLGPGWNKPPKSWWADSRLGLEQMRNVRTLKVFVELDPSHEVFKGFRLGKNFFTDFAAHLLQGVLYRLPALLTVHFETWPSVSHEGPLMRKLTNVARSGGKRVSGFNAQHSCDDTPAFRLEQSLGPS